VLFRINSQSEVYEQALADLGISYQLKGAERFFERPEVRDAVMLLRGAARAGSDPLTADAPDLAGQVRAVLASRGFTPAPPAGSGTVRERWESLAALVRLAEEFEAARLTVGQSTDLAAYVGELDARAAAQHAPAVEGVTLASLHAAKGLEWDAVFLVGLTEGTLPIIYAKTDEQIEEERRLLYVGVTRARLHLSLSWALSRSPGGRASRKPTRFLDGLRPGSSATGPRGKGGKGGVEFGAERSAARKVRGPVKCRVCDRTLTDAVERKLRRCESCPSNMDEALYERLREWRSVQAKKQGAPAYVVFTDATLMAIAEDVPANDRELAVISGVGAMKLDKYGAAVLSLCAGEEPVDESTDEPLDETQGESEESA
jgi:DNA helicase II / ATP-dependent DNA helicase PcrA